MLSSSLLFPPEVVELLKPFAFHTLLKIVFLFLLCSFLPLVICHDCSFCSVFPVLPQGLFPRCLLINVCQCPPFPSSNHFLKTLLFYKMQPFERCSLGLARSSSTLFDRMKPIQNQYNHCFHTWYNHCYLFCFVPPSSVVLIFTCAIASLKTLRSKGGKMAWWLLCFPNFLVLHGEGWMQLVYWGFVPHGPPAQMP